MTCTLGCEQVRPDTASASGPAAPLVAAPAPPAQIGPTDEQIIAAVQERSRHGRFLREAMFGERPNCAIIPNGQVTFGDIAIESRGNWDPAARRVGVRAAISVTANFGQFMGRMNTPGCPAPYTKRFGFDFMISENPVAAGQYVAKTVRMDLGTAEGH